MLQPKPTDKGRKASKTGVRVEPTAANAEAGAAGPEAAAPALPLRPPFKFFTLVPWKGGQATARARAPRGRRSRCASNALAVLWFLNKPGKMEHDLAFPMGLLFDRPCSAM